MNFCQNGIKLIKESLHENIQEYNKELIEEISNEINNDTDKILKLSQDTSKDIADITVKAELQLYITRASKNKRCLLNYLNNRMNKIENLIWTLTGNLPEQVEKNMDEKDKKYYEQYNNLTARYSKMLSLSDLDLTKDYAPPKELYIEVRALENISNIKTNEGTINVEKNRTYSFRKVDIEHYLRMGIFAINE